MKDFYNIKNSILKRLYATQKICFKKLGSRSVFIKPIRIYGKHNISLGDNVKFGEFSRVEALDEWRGTKYYPNLVIGNNTSFEQSAHITCASNLIIGENCTFSSRVMITTISHDYSQINKSVLDNEIHTSDVKIGNNCFIGMDVKIFPGVQIGDNVIIGANSIVMHDLPSYTVCVGVPAKPIKKFNFELGVWEKYAS